jgi:hypothetical protein
MQGLCDLIGQASLFVLAQVEVAGAVNHHGMKLLLLERNAR